MGDVPAAYTTLSQVVDAFAHLEQHFQQRNDRRAIFLSLYSVVTNEMRTRVAKGAFADNPWVERYAVAFANLYRVALEQYDAGNLGAVPKAWRLCFDAARAGSGLVLQDMFLGVNAHVNYDLPFALESISIDPDRRARYADHAAVNAVLASVAERATERITTLYAPGVEALDACAGQMDELLSLFSLQVARESAWESALALVNARSSVERRVAASLIGARSAVMARLLLAPTLSPVFTAACRRIEQSRTLPALLRTLHEQPR